MNDKLWRIMGGIRNEENRTMPIAYIFATDHHAYLKYTADHFLSMTEYPSIFISNLKKDVSVPVIVLDGNLSKERQQQLEQFKKDGFSIVYHKMSESPETSRS